MPRRTADYAEAHGRKWGRVIIVTILPRPACVESVAPSLVPVEDLWRDGEDFLFEVCPMIDGAGWMSVWMGGHGDTRAQQCASR